ncbi:MAG TPA: hypothetical protein VJT72_19505 [Pseudonocardiaceae bacterium]|nr:hypothetical protein [Pseudonocardiaceae bacterium]
MIMASDSPWTVSALAGSGNHDFSAELVKFSFAICSMLVVGAYLAAAFFVGAASIAITQSGALPAWIAPMSWGHTAPYAALYTFTSTISIMIMRHRPSTSTIPSPPDRGHAPPSPCPAPRRDRGPCNPSTWPRTPWTLRPA